MKETTFDALSLTEGEISASTAVVALNVACENARTIAASQQTIKRGVQSILASQIRQRSQNLAKEQKADLNAELEELSVSLSSVISW